MRIEVGYRLVCPSIYGRIVVDGLFHLIESLEVSSRLAVSND